MDDLHTQTADRSLSPNVGRIRIDVQLPAQPSSVRLARSCVAPLIYLCDPDSVDRVRLLVSELVSNSVRHAGLEASDDIELSIQAGTDGIRVAVRDEGEGFSAPDSPKPDPSRERGFGLYLVEQLSDRWGVDARRGSKVWFEV